MAIEFERARTWGRLGALAVGAGATHSAQPHARRDMHLACALRRLARSGLRPISPDMAGTARYNIVKLYIARRIPGFGRGVPRVRALAPCAERALGLARAMRTCVAKVIYSLYGYTPLTLK